MPNSAAANHFVQNSYFFSLFFFIINLPKLLEGKKNITLYLLHHIPSDFLEWFLVNEKLVSNLSNSLL